MSKGTKVRSSDIYDSESKLGERKSSGLNQRGWPSTESEKRSVADLGGAETVSAIDPLIWSLKFSFPLFGWRENPRKRFSSQLYQLKFKMKEMVVCRLGRRR